MITQSSHVVSVLKGVWPELSWTYPLRTSIITTDLVFWLPSYEKLWSLVVESFIDQYQYVANQFECEEFSILLSAFIKQERYRVMQEKGLKKQEHFSWAFGEAYGNFGGGPHAINICVCDDKKIYLIEPQNDKIRPVNPKMDVARFIRI